MKSPSSSSLSQQGLRVEGDINLSEHRRAWHERDLNAKTRALLAEDAEYFVHQAMSTPCLNALRGAKGAWIEDLEGRRYLDFHGNNVHQVGFGHPRVISAIKKQLDQLPFCTRRYTNEPAVRLAEKLVKMSPTGLERVLFAPGGASAIGMALKLARVVTGRFKTISMWDSFHGASLDAISIGGEAAFRQNAGPLLPGCEHVPPPDPSHCPFRCGKSCSMACADYVEYVMEREGDVAAVIAETVRNVPVVPPPDYWKRIRTACDRHGALLILDEIPIGLGRTGKFCAFENFGILPDIVVLGKGLGGGIFPLAGILTKPRFNVAAERSLGHFTHEKNPAACAAGLATLEVIEEGGLVARAAMIGAGTLADLRQRLAGHPLVRDVRGLGLLLGVEVGAVDARNGGVKTDPIDLAERTMYAALRRGLNFKVSKGNVLTFAPPLNVTEVELEKAWTIIEDALNEVAGDTGVAAPAHSKSSRRGTGKARQSARSRRIAGNNS
jgi:4-aminobutyrate aminotransferase